MGRERRGGPAGIAVAPGSETVCGRSPRNVRFLELFRIVASAFSDRIASNPALGRPDRERLQTACCHGELMTGSRLSFVLYSHTVDRKARQFDVQLAA
jgi:hypothetical protein